MSDMKKFLRRKRRISDRRTIYYLRPIKCVPSRGEHESDEEYDERCKESHIFEFEKPTVIVDKNYVGAVLIYFNYHHPNRHTIKFKYGKYFYGLMCLGDLYRVMQMVDNPKYPEILHNYFSEYSDSGYWHPNEDDGHVDDLCPACSRPTHIEGEYCEGCEIVDRHGHSVDPEDMDDDDVNDPKKYSWSNKLKAFVYKGRLKDDDDYDDY